MSYTWDTLPAVGTSETMETDIRNTLEQWRVNFADIDSNVHSFLSGAGAPSDLDDGNDGDFYIDTTAWDVYGPKTAGAWGAGTSLIGADGADGADGSGGIAYEIISTNTLAVAAKGYLIDASSGNVTLTLPATPTVGDTVAAVDFYNKATTNTITMARNGSKIEGLEEDLVINVNGAGFTLVFTDATRGWEIVSEVSGATSASATISDVIALSIALGG